MSARILLIATTTGYQTRVFDEAAQRIGYQLILATDRCHVLDDPWGDRAIALRFEDPQKSARSLAGLWPRPDGLIAVGDRPALLAAMAAEHLQLPYNTVRSVELTRNKFEARRRYRAAGMLVPEFYRLPVDLDPAEPAQHAHYPCVLKPLGLSASRGVIRANDPSEFAAAFLRIRALLASPDIARLRDEQDRWVQVEQYIDGEEYAVEGLLERGKLRVLAIFDKPDPLTGPYFEETIYVTPSRAPDSVQQALIEAVQRAVEALGLQRGPVHAELRVNERGAWVLELAARPIGGLCAQALRFDSGHQSEPLARARGSAITSEPRPPGSGDSSLEELLLRHAAGEDVSGFDRESAASGVMMIPIPRNGIFVEAKGLDAARSVPGITDIAITAKPGQKMMKLPEGASYLGFLFARSAKPAEVEHALREAHAILRFEIAAELEVLNPST